MFCRGWTSRIFIGSKWPETSSQSTCDSGTSRWRVDSVAYGKTPLPRIRITSWRSGTKKKSKATRGAATVLVTLWTNRQVTQRPLTTPHTWESDCGYYEVLGLPQMWRANHRAVSSPLETRLTIQCGHAETVRIPIARPCTRACLESALHYPGVQHLHSGNIAPQ